MGLRLRLRPLAPEEVRAQLIMRRRPRLEIEFICESSADSFLDSLVTAVRYKQAVTALRYNSRPK